MNYIEFMIKVLSFFINILYLLNQIIFLINILYALHKEYYFYWDSLF